MFVSRTGVPVISVELIVRDGAGRRVDLGLLGVDRLIDLVRARPPDEQAQRGLPRGGLDPVEVEGGAARLALEAVELAAREVAALRMACIGAVADRAQEQDGLGSDRVLDELMAELLISRRSAQFAHRQAESVRAWPEVWVALASGAIDPTRAAILAEALFAIPRTDGDGVPRPHHAEECAALTRAGLAYAQEHTARQLDRFLRRTLLALGCPDRARRRRRALAERGVWIAHDGEGTAELTARLSSEDAERVYAAIRGIALADRNGEPAGGCPDPTEPLGVWMAAALVDAVLGCGSPWSWPAEGDTAAVPPRAAGAPGVQTVVNVTIPVASLAGLDDEPGVLSGFGVIPADTARRLAGGDARWRHILTCPSTGAVLDVGTLSYRPPAALARHVRLRDGTCRFPGCAVPASECDLDHLVPFPAGPTAASNLHALCRRHHGLKHEGRWQVTQVDGQGLRWTSPQGAMATTWPDDTLVALGAAG
jgi:hypothetical protein